MPTASVTIATIEKCGCFNKLRAPKRMSLSIEFITASWLIAVTGSYGWFDWEPE